MVKHLTHRFGGPFGWDGQAAHGSFDSQSAAAEDQRSVERIRTRMRNEARNAKLATTMSVLREAFPRQED